MAISSVAASPMSFTDSRYQATSNMHARLAVFAARSYESSSLLACVFDLFSNGDNHDSQVQTAIYLVPSSYQEGVTPIVSLRKYEQSKDKKDQVVLTSIAEVGSSPWQRKPHVV